MAKSHIHWYQIPDSPCLNVAEATTTANRPTLGFDTSTKPEPLTGKVLDTKDNFGWINHTYAALQMDRLCPDPDEPQPGLCPVTDYATAKTKVAAVLAVYMMPGPSTMRTAERSLVARLMMSPTRWRW